MDNRSHGSAQAGTATTDALHELLAGNQRFISNTRQHPHQDVDRRTLLAAGQQPFALIFGCADSRVAAEIIFDRGLGDLFVVRTAGHVVDNSVLGSIEFGVEVLQIPLIVVLGHDSCGAVQASMNAYTSGEMPGGHLRDIVEKVTPSIIAGRRQGVSEVDAMVERHAVSTANLLVQQSAAISRRVEQGQLGVVALGYALSEGRAKMLGALPTALTELAD